MEELRSTRDEEIQNIDDQIRELRSQKSDLEYKTSQQLRILETDLHERCSILHKDIDNVQFILHALRLEKNQKLSWEINNYHEKYVEELEDFYTSKTMKLTTYILENDWRNKVNRYSLFIIGKTIFNDKFDLDLPNDYPPISTTRANIHKFIKKLPTSEDLKSYYTRNKTRILTKFLESHAQLEETYCNIIENYTLTDFLPLAKTKCTKCGYFVVEPDNHNYYLEHSECPMCYEKSYFKVEKEEEESKVS